MAPLKRLTKKEIGLCNRPWITNEILKSMAERDSLYKEFTVEKDQTKKNELYTSYKQLRNAVINSIRISKKCYYESYFTDHKDNIRKTWDGIRDIINISKKSSSNINKIIDKGSFICDDLGKAKALNNFFVSIGSSVEKKIPAAKSSFSLFLGERKLNNFHVINVTKDEVLENIKKLGKNKSSGPFSIPVNILKDYTSILADPLVYIINKSLNEGIFPTLVKSARVCPIYKKGDRFKCENYRPISLLSNVSKIFEIIHHDQLSKFRLFKL